MDDQTVIMIGFGCILALATGLGIVAAVQRMPAKPAPVEEEEEEAEAESAAPVAAASSSSKKKKKKKDKAEADDAERANLPVISVGTRCWHRQAKEWVIVAKVYYDDPPPYYAVTMSDGSERATVRARLDTQQEREAETAAAQRRDAEARAEAAAAELLAEEAKQPRRRPTSEGKGSKKKR